ncbi:hypothetical protein D6783_03885 [Candidatus Woesearchaeota archaeon]|nr:MAG: hypothetical protein D6783_03885 [Candidatus Woesearchaeota archaeon]
MAFAYTVNNNGVPEVLGRKRMVSGTFTNGATDTGGDIKTGLRRVEFFAVQLTGAAVASNAPVVNESFPTSTGDITIVTDANADGIWYAIGE